MGRKLETDYNSSREIAVGAAEFGWRMVPFSAALTVRGAGLCQVLGTPTDSRLCHGVLNEPSSICTHSCSATCLDGTSPTTIFQHPRIRDPGFFASPKLAPTISEFKMARLVPHSVLDCSHQSQNLLLHLCSCWCRSLLAPL
jgi:hypothetical protein